MFSCISLCKSLLVGGFGSGFAMLRPIRAPLHNLDTFVHPEIVPILLQFAPQRINRYNQFCFHLILRGVTIEEVVRQVVLLITLYRIVLLLPFGNIFAHRIRKD